MSAVEAAGNALRFLVRAAFVVRGVNERQNAVIVRGASGKTALLIILIGLERHGFARPVGEIIARNVSPVHRPPFGRVRIELIKRMKFAADVNQPVRVVDPAAAGVNMIARRIRMLRHNILL